MRFHDDHWRGRRRVMDMAPVTWNDNTASAHDQNGAALYQHETLLHTFLLCAVNALCN